MTDRKQNFLTYQNHFEFGRVIGYPDVYFSKLNCANRPVQKSLDESVLAAQKIKAEAKNEKLNLCLSGGIDSEVMLQAFLKSGVDFEATVMRFHNGFNEFDIYNVFEMCESKNIKLSVIDIDILDFFESGRYFAYGEKYQCQSPQIATHLWLLDQIEGFPVLSGNFIYPQHTDNGIFYLGLPGDLHCTYFRYFEKQNRAGAPWFMIYTPELNQSFFKTPTIQKQVSLNIDNQIPFTYQIKCDIYNEAGFQVNPRPDKYTGFEKVREHYDQLHNTTHGIKFDELFRRPLEKLNPLPSEYLQIVPEFSDFAFAPKASALEVSF